MSFFGWIRKNNSQQMTQKSIPRTGRNSVSPAAKTSGGDRTQEELPEKKVGDRGDSDILELIADAKKGPGVDLKDDPVENSGNSGFEAVDSDEDDFCLKSVEIDPERVITSVRGTGAGDTDGAEESLSEEDDEDDAKETGGNRRSLYAWASGSGKKKKMTKLPKAVKEPVAVGRIMIGEGLPKICVPLTGQNREEILRQCAEAVQASPDLVEWRVDYFEENTDREALDEVLRRMADILRDLPVLFTYRTASEGGEMEPDPQEYCEVLKWAAGRAQIAAIDVEGMKRDIDPEILIREIHALGKPVIGSTHFFERTPKKAEMEAVFDCLERIDADILKLAVMPEKAKDVTRLLNATIERNEITSRPVVTMSMGDLGRVSRVSGRVTGSAMTFGTVGLSSAPGQLPVESLREIMRQL
uniref:type I 3-dehydroquinate dehydratase n=1 Tax=Eubacterium cellulosolvens TaxID=29322 RepID=UPI000A91E6AA|nr:type I 3-dehydroquinate dehydratase [[Eubacterium] cellulosolvens]